MERGNQKFDFQIAHPQELRGERYAVSGPVEGEVEITDVGGDYLLDLHVRCSTECTCDRCGETFISKVEGKVKTLYTFDRFKTEGKWDLDIQLLPRDARSLDFTQDVVDAIHLAMPVRCLCREDCAGLCPKCGINLNEGKCRCTDETEDPRWEALRKLK